MYCSWKLPIYLKNIVQIHKPHREEIHSKYYQKLTTLRSCKRGVLPFIKSLQYWVIQTRAKLTPALQGSGTLHIRHFQDFSFYVILVLPLLLLPPLILPVLWCHTQFGCWLTKNTSSTEMYPAILSFREGGFILGTAVFKKNNIYQEKKNHYSLWYFRKIPWKSIWDKHLCIMPS